MEGTNAPVKMDIDLIKPTVDFAKVSALTMFFIDPSVRYAN